MSLLSILDRLGRSWVDEEEEQELLDESFEEDYEEYLNGADD